MRRMTIKIGDTFSTTKDGVVVVIEAKSSAKIKVKFINTGAIGVFRTQSLRKGTVRDPNRVLDCAGYIGQGDYSWSKNTKAYQCWRNMLRRCYDKGCEKYKSYGAKNVTVCSEWHNFQNFAAWWEREYSTRECVNETYEVDKDVNGGFVYSEDTCVLLPREINSFIKRNIAEGVPSFHREHEAYRVHIASPDGKSSSCCNYKTEEEVVQAWCNGRIARLSYLQEKYKCFPKTRGYLDKVRSIFLENFKYLTCELEADTYENIKDKQKIK